MKRRHSKIHYLLRVGIACALLVLAPQIAYSAAAILEHEAAWAIERANVISEEMDQGGLIVDDPEITQYLQAIVEKLLASTSIPIDYLNVQIIKDDRSYAFSLPNNQIYLNLGLISHLENEAQLAAVVAKEMAHVGNGFHIEAAIEFKKSNMTSNFSDLLLIGTIMGKKTFASKFSNFNQERDEKALVDALAMLEAANYDISESVEIFRVLGALPEYKGQQDSIFSSTHDDNLLLLEQLKTLISTNYPAEQENAIVGKAEFEPIKGKLLGLQVRLQLSDRRYSMALHTLDLAETYFSKVPVIDFYRAEAYRGMADYPLSAAREKHWIETGKESDKYLDEYLEKTDQNYDKAITYYQQSLASDIPYEAAYRGLGQVHKSRGSKELAIQYFQTYLDKTGTPKDYRYINRLIKNLRAYY
ncbi:MAG: M48 family metalloprotease [Pseudomonadales bacterium]